ncbi:MAG TPA: phosphoglycerate dehydrogenase [Gammaproteobacteria bacterium]|nr:phosphoglycerate dehydrogenase [Gammaproteobacteria bacterium]
MFKILTLNNISPAGLERFSTERYTVGSELTSPDAILLRSFDMHDYEIPPSLKAVARAGAGVNNIPVARLSQRGIPVFNTPGANANAVKELVLAGMLLGARNICQAWRFVESIEGDDAALDEGVEAGKRSFVGFELPGRTLGVIGLGAIGVLVANAALRLGMRVMGYDPELTVRRAWQLSSEVIQAQSLKDLLGQSDFVTIHVPLSERTKELINSDSIRDMRREATLLNFSRRGIVVDDAVVGALDAGMLNAYVCDFPTTKLRGHAKIVALPHIGASTREAEANCAVMASRQLRDFLEDGNITNSVNFPEVVMPRISAARVALVNANVPNMLGQISTTLARADLNILDMLNRSRGELAYTLTDVEGEIPPKVLADLAAIDGVMSVRAL